MSETITISGPSQLLDERICLGLRKSKPKVIGVVSAFVTVDGVDIFVRAMRRLSVKECRLVAGTSHHITHPEALENAKRLGWKVRLGKLPESPGIFHPKLIVGGESFDNDDLIAKPCFMCIGSANLTGHGLKANTECNLIATGEDCAENASEAFKEFWSSAVDADKAALEDYAATFAERNRKRSLAELDALGVSVEGLIQIKRLMRQKRQPKMGAMRTQFAVAAWAGLESFTGEYTFQVEFPRAAGEVLRSLVGRRKSRDGYVKVYCHDDEETVRMKYSYYVDNSMFRLNIPNNTTGVSWARKNKEGIVLVERGPAGGAPLRLRLLQPSPEASEVIARSHALRTWGKTTKRLYGWY